MTSSPGLHQRADAHVNGLAAAHGNQHLAPRARSADPSGGQDSGRSLPAAPSGPRWRCSGCGLVPGSRMPASRTAQGVLKSGSPTPRLDAVRHLGGHDQKICGCRRAAWRLRGRRNQSFVIHHSTVHSLSSISSSWYSAAVFFVGAQHKVSGRGQHIVQRAQPLCHKQGDLLEASGRLMTSCRS